MKFCERIIPKTVEVPVSECQQNNENYLRLLTKTLKILVSEWLGIHISFSLKLFVSKILKLYKIFT